LDVDGDDDADMVIGSVPDNLEPTMPEPFSGD
jgi:hypothetical protein